MRAGWQTPFSSSVLVKGTSLGKSWFCTSRAMASSDSRRSFSLATMMRRPRFSVKDASRGGVRIGQSLAHSGELRALSGEKECGCGCQRWIITAGGPIRAATVRERSSVRLVLEPLCRNALQSLCSHLHSRGPMRRIIISCSLAAALTLAVLSSVQAQQAATQPKAKPGKSGAAKVAAAPSYGNADAITEDELKVYDYFLASDQLEGRYFPSRGYDTAALYVASHLAEWGLKPGGSTTGTNGPLQPYFMPIEMAAKTLVPEDSKASLTAPPAGGGRGGFGGGAGGGQGGGARGGQGGGAGGGANATPAPPTTTDFEYG